MKGWKEKRTLIDWLNLKDRWWIFHAFQNENSISKIKLFFHCTNSSRFMVSFTILPHRNNSTEEVRLSDTVFWPETNNCLSISYHLLCVEAVTINRYKSIRAWIWDLLKHSRSPHSTLKPLRCFECYTDIFDILCCSVFCVYLLVLSRITICSSYVCHFRFWQDVKWKYILTHRHRDNGQSEIWD